MHESVASDDDTPDVGESHHIYEKDRPVLGYRNKKTRTSINLHTVQLRE